MWEYFTHGPLGIIALCFFVVISITAALIKYSGNTLDTKQKNILIYFMLTFTCLIVLVFVVLVIFFPNKLYSPKDFKNEEYYLKSIGVEVKANEVIKKNVENIEGMNYSNTRVYLDYHVYKSCCFKNCRLIYSGDGPVGIIDCQTYGCHFAFDGSAASTMIFLNQIYNKTGEAGKQLVENTFQSIRDGKFPSVVLKIDWTDPVRCLSKLRMHIIWG